MKKYIKLIPMSLCSILIIAILSVVYGFIAHVGFTLRYVFSVNFFIGAILIVAGFLLMFIPSVYSNKKSQHLLDSSTFAQRSFDDREKRQGKARMILWLGLFNMIFTGLIQVLLSIII